MTAPAPEPSKPTRALILAAMPFELRDVVLRLGLRVVGDRQWADADGGLEALTLGMGPTSSRRARDALSRQPTRRVILVGFCGGLVEGLSRGEIVRPGSVVDEATGRRLPLSDEAEGCTAVTADRPALSPRAKRDLARRCDASIVDMETYHVVATCRSLGVPCDVIRAVSDTVEDAIDPAVMKLVDADGKAHFGRAVGLVIRRPTLLPRLIALGRRGKAASAALADAVTEELADG